MAPPAPPASIAPVPVQNAPVPAVVVADDVAAAVAEPEAEPVAEPVAVDAVVPDEHAGDANIAEGDGRTEEQGDESVCVICHDTIDKTDQANTHFHWCGHVFHRFCMMDWKQVSRKPYVDCPNRCQTLLQNGRLNGVLMLDQINSD